MCLTKLLPTMTSIWLNYINDFDYSQNVKKKHVSVWARVV